MLVHIDPNTNQIDILPYGFILMVAYNRQSRPRTTQIGKLDFHNALTLSSLVRVQTNLVFHIVVVHSNKMCDTVE